MLLILSSRMVNEDIALHYGRLPPSFLPLGNKRLFSLQAELAGNGPIAMTVPQDFEIASQDLRHLEDLGIRLLPQDAALPLPRAIHTALSTLRPQGPLRLLYGDTLVRFQEDEPFERDRITVQETTSNYQWAYVVRDGDIVQFSDAAPRQLESRQVVCGDFVFSDPDRWMAACTEKSIIDALNTYNDSCPFDVVQAEDWFDFGHLPLYFQSKKSIMIKRMFNHLTYEDHILVKQSKDTAKIRAESHWYENLPADLSLHTPRYQGRIERDNLAGYGIEYLYHPLLSDLDAFGALPLPSWLEILSGCFEAQKKCQAIRPDPGAPEASEEFASRFYDDMIVGKTWARLEAYVAGAGLDMQDEFVVNGVSHPPLQTVIERVLAQVPRTTPDHIRFWHGDMFFGNLFYDFTARRVMMIDPRGQTSDRETCLYGDWRYDLAKLSHSVIGKYDKIILGRFILTEEAPKTWTLTFSEMPAARAVEAILKEHYRQDYGLGGKELLALTALLFFSMLPLHGDRPDLQQAILVNGLRLAGLMEEEPE